MQLYSPDRPLVDTAEVFLWLMAVGTILCASYWSAWSAREASIEYEKLIKVLINSLLEKHFIIFGVLESHQKFSLQLTHG